MTSRLGPKAAARLDPVYIAVYDEAVQRLQDKGEFAKVDVIKGCSMRLSPPTVKALRWEWIVEFIMEDYGLDDMLTLAEGYFKKHPLEEERLNPAKYLAIGNGKEIYGYATVCEARAHLVVRQLEQRLSNVKGQSKALQERRYYARRQIGRDDLGPMLQGPPEPEPEPVTPSPSPSPMPPAGAAAPMDPSEA